MTSWRDRPCLPIILRQSRPDGPRAVGGGGTSAAAAQLGALISESRSLLPSPRLPAGILRPGRELRGVCTVLSGALNHSSWLLVVKGQCVSVRRGGWESSDARAGARVLVAVWSWGLLLQPERRVSALDSSPNSASTPLWKRQIQKCSSR